MARLEAVVSGNFVDPKLQKEIDDFLKQDVKKVFGGFISSREKRARDHQKRADEVAAAVAEVVAAAREFENWADDLAKHSSEQIKDLAIRMSHFAQGQAEVAKAADPVAAYKKLKAEHSDLLKRLQSDDPELKLRPKRLAQAAQKLAKLAS